MNYARGIDVNHFNSPFDWRAVFDSGVSFVGVKATQGRTFVDPKFTEHRERAGDDATAVLLYHFAGLDAGAVKQAEQFVAAVGELGPLELPVLDLERSKTGVPFMAGDPTGPKLFERAGVFVATVERELGITPLLYTRNLWRDAGDPSPAWAAGCDLWVPRYRDLELGPGTLPGPWEPERWTFWQWTDGGATGPAHLTPGAGAVDANVFNGEESDLEAYVMARHVGR
jgi:lysozyme